MASEDNEVLLVTIPFDGINDSHSELDKKGIIWNDIP